MLISFASTRRIGGAGQPILFSVLFFTVYTSSAVVFRSLVVTMGNDLSSSTRTSIPLDDVSCWQLYNGVNERSEPISIFLGKQTFSVECRRSIQFLKSVRHPNILKFLAGFKTSVEQDSFLADCVHPLAMKLTNNDLTSSTKLGLGLYQLTQGLEFLHLKASISHNNVCLASVYLSLNGLWKLGNFECACRYETLTKKYLASLKVIRAEECVTPEETEQESTDLATQQIYAIDVYGLGTLIASLLSLVQVDDPMKSLFMDLQTSLTDEDPQSRPTWSRLLKTQLFQIDYIKATELLDRLPTVDQADLENEVESLSTYLDALPSDSFNELLIRRLLAPFMFLCSTTRLKLLPRILVPQDETNSAWIPAETYREHVVPLLIDLFSYHVISIRESLLEYFHSYWQLIDRTTLVNSILPQLVYGLKDSNNGICMSTLIALAAMVPVLGADVVIGGQRKQIFTDRMRREVVFPKGPPLTSNSPMATSPVKQRKASPPAKKKLKPVRLKSVSPVRVNGHRSPTPPLPPPVEIVPEKPSPIVIPADPLEDDDDGQWSDWEHSVDASPPAVFEEKLSPPPIKPLQLVTINAKSKWDPNAPLGSEYEIPPLALSKSKKVVASASEDNVDDFFKDMTPKVQTVELMRQLETMFHVDVAPARTSNKFGIAPEDHSDQHEGQSENNWDD